MTATSESSDIELSRIYEAPVQAVWDAWTEPDQTAQWWGPRGFTLTSHSKDVRSGGSWDYTMHGPDGTDYPNITRYLDVEPLVRLVYDHGASAGNPPLFRVTVRFSETDGKTRMDMRMSLPTPEAAAQTRQFIRQAGGDATWDRLAEYLAKRLAGREIFVINRSFEATQERLFAMWADPQQLLGWLAPTGMTMRFIRADIRPGGSTHYCMSGPAMTLYGRAHYESIRSPERLVYTQQFCDEHEGSARHPLAPDWPETMRTIVAFTAEGPQRSRVTVTWEVTGPVTGQELAVFCDARAGMTLGWTGSFDKLEAALAARPAH